MSTRFIDEQIMRQEPDGVRLVGGACDGCGLVSFPRARACARCGGGQIAERLLAREGTIWTWTSQGFPVKRPYTGPTDPFEPFVVGYVELPDGVRVESRILATPEEVAIDQEVELVLEPHTQDPDGTTVLMFAFRPKGVTS